MLFNSIAFILYLPIVFAVYWLLRRSLFAQNLFVVVASYVFYGWWDWRFLILLNFTSIWAWASGLVIERYRNRTNVARFVLALALLVNLGILGVFKYYNFFLDNFIVLSQFAGFNCNPSSLRIILPVGISFYTFQALSYVIDVFRCSIRPTRNLVAFLAFVSFFPQLVAGPIERATNLLPQFLRARNFDYSQAVDGCRQMLWGFLKKMVIADNCAALVNRIFNSSANPSGFGVAVGAFAFTLQIYGDFSGYSDIAIGCARLFGVKLMRNFAFPYFSRDIAEFWRRWHISLNTWFRDYLYIPLGGSRVGIWKKIRNTYAIFLVSGFWHGANWTFILWGAFHATLFLPLLLLNANRKYVGNSTVVGFWSKTKCGISWLITFILVVFGWLLFRAPDVATFGRWVGSLMAFSLNSGIYGYKIQDVPWLIIICAFIVEFINRNSRHALERLPSFRGVRYLIYFVVLSVILYYRGGQTDFIYFQF